MPTAYSSCTYQCISNRSDETAIENDCPPSWMPRVAFEYVMAKDSYLIIISSVTFVFHMSIKTLNNFYTYIAFKRTFYYDIFLYSI